MNKAQLNLISSFFSKMTSNSDNTSNDQMIQIDDDSNELQPELILNVLSGLPVFSLLQSKLVCKSWHAMSQETHFLALHLSRAARADPCLILSCDRNKLYFVDSSHYHDMEGLKKLNSPFVSSMTEFDVVGSCNGLLCLSDTYKGVLHVHNPFTKHSMELPEASRYSNHMVVHGFGVGTRTYEYKVVRVTYYSHGRIGILRGGGGFTPEQSEVQIMSLGGSQWRSIGKVPCHLIPCASQVLVNGRLHWVGWRHRNRSACMIISMDVDDEEFKEVGRPDCGAMDGCSYNLVVMRGCLAAAVEGKGVVEIWVMKEYGVKESWVKEMVVVIEADRRIQNGKVVCVLESGEVLMEFGRRALVCYDTKRGSCRELVFNNLPTRFQTHVHVGTFNWLDTPIHV